MRKTVWLLFFIYCVCLLTPAQADELYYWTDENGVRHVSSEPPPASVQQAKSLEYSKETPKTPEPVTQKKDTSQISPDQMTPPPEEKDDEIIMYTRRTDPKCYKAREWFYHAGIKYTEKQVDGNEAVLNAFKEAGGREFPFIVIGEKTYSGMAGVNQVLELKGVKGQSY